MPYWFVFAAISVLTLFLNFIARSLAQLKYVAYTYLVLFLGFFTTFFLQKVSASSIFSLPNVLVISLFTISLSIPWKAREVLWLILTHVVALVVYRGRSLHDGQMALLFRDPIFSGGFPYLALAGIVSLLVKGHEEKQEIRNFLLLKELEEKNKKIEDQNDQMNQELEFAARIHQTLVPESVHTPQAEVAVTYLPLTSIGGDFATFRFLEDGRLLVIISDVTGHGVPAALLVNRVHSEFEHLLQNFKGPGELLRQLDRFILRDFDRTEMYLSAFCALLDLKNGILRYSGHGHPPQYLFRPSGGQLVRLDSQTSFMGIGMNDDGQIYENETSLNPEDRLVLFTDGVLETLGQNKEQYGSGRLESFIRQNANVLSASLWNEKLLMDLEAFKKSDFMDDIFLMHIIAKNNF